LFLFTFAGMIVINGIKEKVLIRRFIKGDHTAFELLFRFYYPGMVIFTSNIVLNNEDAEEIVQDFFVKLWSKRNLINDTSSLKNYLFTSVKNRAVNFLKKQQLNRKVTDKLEEMVSTDQLYNPDLFILSELQTKINNACGKLQPRTREIFSLSRFKGLSNDEIADQLNISKRTVETQISKALKVLREELKDYLFLLMVF
jgi:RNA polymerase sigma-70 factor (ECF subfamily)